MGTGITTSVDGGGLEDAAGALRNDVGDILAALSSLESTVQGTLAHHWRATSSDEFGEIYATWAAALRSGLHGLELLADGVASAGST